MAAMPDVPCVVVCGGGARKHAVLSMLNTDPTVWDHATAQKAFGPATPPPTSGYAVTFSEAVHGESLTSVARLEAQCPDVMALLALDAAQVAEFGACAAAARPANRRKLGCLLANLRAMDAATRSEAATGQRCLILEDNVRVLKEGGAARARAVLAAAAAESVDMTYLGWLAHDDVVPAVSAAVHASGALLTEHRPEQVANTDGKDATANTELWGTYAYTVSRRFFEFLLQAIRDDFPRAVFRMARRDCHITAIDKLIQRKLRRAPDSLGLTLRVAAPLAFRMPPVLPSKIRKAYDEPYFLASALQLAAFGMTWDDVWLTETEAQYAAGRTEVGGNGGHSGDTTRASHQQPAEAAAPPPTPAALL